MSLKKKIFIMALAVIIFMLLIPFIVIRLIPGDMGLGFSFILFFSVCPLVIIFLGILSGTDIKKLFIAPTVGAFLFPFCYALALLDMVWELFVYSALYSVAGAFVMVATHFYLKHKKEKKETEK